MTLRKNSISYVQESGEFSGLSFYLIISLAMFHEDRSQISLSTQDMKRAIDSFREELEAVDWYNQRAEACTDPELKRILLHNAKEEKEHASMLLEWIRRNDPEMDHELRDNLFREGPIAGDHEQ